MWFYIDDKKRQIIFLIRINICECVDEFIFIKCVILRETFTFIWSCAWILPLVYMLITRVASYQEDDIEKYFRASHFSGKDQLYCDKCEEKSDATIVSNEEACFWFAYMGS